MKTYLVGTHKKRLDEVLLKSTHKIRFYREKKEYPQNMYSLEVPRQGTSNENLTTNVCEVK